MLKDKTTKLYVFGDVTTEGRGFGMECRTCGIVIPSKATYYRRADKDGVQCEECAVEDYKEASPYWDIKNIKSPAIVDLDCKS